MKTSFALLALCAATVHADEPVQRSMEVRQFGAPGDAAFIFCDWPLCPERTIKTLTIPKFAPAPMVQAPTQPTPFAAPAQIPLAGNSGNQLSTKE